MANPDASTMYLRGVPRKLVQEAKAEAARRGMTLTAFVREVLSNALGLQNATEPVPELRDDLTWFEANRAKLWRRYPNEYVAIINRKVVDHDKQFAPLAERVFKRYGVRSICMPKVTQTERVISIPSPQIVR